MSNEAPREIAVRSVERAISILDLLAVGGWRTGADIARELRVHRSTALRLLGTLERHSLVERDQRTARYRLGRRLPQLASVVTGEFDLRYGAPPGGACPRGARAWGGGGSQRGSGCLGRWRDRCRPRPLRPIPPAASWKPAGPRSPDPRGRGRHIAPARLSRETV